MGVVLRWLQTMYAHLTAEVSSHEDFAAASRGWLEGTLKAIFPEFLGALQTRPVVRSVPRPKDDIDLPWGQPGHVLGTLDTYWKHPAFGGRESLYSGRAWQRMLDRLVEYPWAVRVTITELGDRGFPLHQGSAVVAVKRDAYAPDWATFTFVAEAADTGWPDSPQVQDRWADYVRDQAEQIGACAGGLTDDLGGAQLALHRVTFMKNHQIGISDSRVILRGYTWATVLASELAGKLGGAKALEATGAFYDVKELRGGAVWLRATPTINEFTGEHVRRVFEALAPVLITGEARIPSNEDYRIVNGVDAADYR